VPHSRGASAADCVASAGSTPRRYGSSLGATLPTACIPFRWQDVLKPPVQPGGWRRGRSALPRPVSSACDRSGTPKSRGTSECPHGLRLSLVWGAHSPPGGGPPPPRALTCLRGTTALVGGLARPGRGPPGHHRPA